MTAKSSKGYSNCTSVPYYHPTERSCENLINARDGTAQLECISANEDVVEDAIAFGLTADDGGLQVNVNYKTLDEMEDLTSFTDIEYNLVFSGLCEYLPSNDTEKGFDVLNDKVVQVLDFEEWKPLSQSYFDEDGVYSFKLSTFDEIVTFYFHHSKKDIAELGLSANRVKMDVEINNFPFERNDTFITLLAAVDSRTEIKAHYSNGVYYPTDVMAQTGLEDAPWGEFTWVKTATMNDSSETCPIVATSPPPADYTDPDDVHGEYAETRSASSQFKYKDTFVNGNSQLIAFSFINSSLAEKIYWDPEMGVRYPDEVISVAGSNGLVGGLRPLSDSLVASSAFSVYGTSLTAFLLLTANIAVLM